MSDFKCDNSRRLPIHQLNKLDVCDISRYDIFPLSVIQAIFDATSGIRLDSILSAMNFLFIPYAGSDEATRLQIPLKGRHRSLIISYIDYDKNIHIEQYVNDCFRDASWKCNKNWKCPFTEGTFILNVGDEKLTELLIPIFNQYIRSEQFINLVAQAVFNWLNTNGETVFRKVINEELDKRKLVYYDTIQKKYQVFCYNENIPDYSLKDDRAWYSIIGIDNDSYLTTIPTYGNNNNHPDREDVQESMKILAKDYITIEFANYIPNKDAIYYDPTFKLFDENNNEVEVIKLSVGKYRFVPDANINVYNIKVYKLNIS